MTVFANNISESTALAGITLDHIVTATNGVKAPSGGVEATFFATPSTAYSIDERIFNIGGSITADGTIYGFRFLPVSVSTTNSAVTTQSVVGIESTGAILSSAPNAEHFRLFSAQEINQSIGSSTNLKEYIGYYSNIVADRPSNTSANYEAYNFYAEGEAPNYFAGNVLIGGTDASSPNITLTASNGNASFAGAVSKGSGSFKIPHPLPELNETHNLVHSFIEGPQADNIYRGQVNLVDGEATVNLDTAARMTEGTFVLLNTNISCFTSNETDWTAVRGSVSGNILTIEAQDNTSTATVSWMVVGERQDQHILSTDWTDENGRVITEPEKSSQ